MTWRVFNSMKALNDFCVFILRKLVFGERTPTPWVRETYMAARRKWWRMRAGFEPQYPDTSYAGRGGQNHSRLQLRLRACAAHRDLLQAEEEGRCFGSPTTSRTS